MNTMRQSFLKNRTGILLMVVSAIMACLGQLCWKISTQTGFGMMILGFAFYGIGALFMLAAYKHGSLSVLQPMISLNYVLSLILGAAVLHEPITWAKIVGILIIICGIVLIGGGDD